MTTEEIARLHLYARARSTWGDEAAATLMAALPRAADKREVAVPAPVHGPEPIVRAAGGGRVGRVDWHNLALIVCCAISQLALVVAVVAAARSR